MQIVIQARGFTLTASLRKYIERRIRFALDWAKYHVRKVSVRLSDLNGPRGGEDKRCHIQVAIPGGANVVIEDIQADLYVAIDRAADRVGHTLARRVERKREHRHDSARGVGSEIEPEFTSGVVPTGDSMSAIDTEVELETRFVLSNN
ncbi:MAG: HPF/RaiA family ribosome-associated protein [Herbaspirillum sp.]